MRKKINLQFKNELRPNKTDYKYIEFIQSFKKEYMKFINPTTLIKLQVLEWTLNCYEPRIIKKYLEESEFTQDQIKTYLRSDNKKINRIWVEHRTIQHLPWLIGIDNLVQMILKKYPFPELAGLPHELWTDERMLEYICLRFNISLENCDSSIKIPKMGTIKNSLCKFDTKYESLDKKLQYYLEHSSDYKLYYLHMFKKTYIPSKEDNANAQKKLRYNATFFSLIFELKKDITQSYKDKILYTSYNKKGYEILLDYIFDYFYNLFKPGGEENIISKKEPVFIVRLKGRKKMLKLYYKELKTAPKYHFLFFDTYDDIYSSLKKINNNQKNIKQLKTQLENNFLDIQDITNSSPFQKQLEKRKEIKQFIEGMVYELEDID